MIRSHVGSTDAVFGLIEPLTTIHPGLYVLFVLDTKSEPGRLRRQLRILDRMCADVADDDGFFLLDIAQAMRYQGLRRAAEEVKQRLCDLKLDNAVPFKPEVV